jgi:hypothetical protein
MVKLYKMSFDEKLMFYLENYINYKNNEMENNLNFEFMSSIELELSNQSKM